MSLAYMNSQLQNSLQNHEDRTLSELLKQLPNATASDQFVDKVMHAARLTPQDESTFAGFALKLSDLQRVNPFLRWGAIAAAIVITISCLRNVSTRSTSEFTADAIPHLSEQEINQADTTDGFAELQQVADQEVLLAATEHMNAFSDSELASLMGF